MQVIPIFFTFDRNYVVPAMVAIYSLLQNASKDYDYALYVLYSNLREKDRNRIEHVVDAFSNATIQFIDVSQFDSSLNHLKVKSHFSKEIYYKLIVADIFPQYDRILCSDVDVVFERDISSSYFLFPDEEFCYAGVGQILESNRMKEYGQDFTSEELHVLEEEIGAGYMLVNLKYIRENGFQQKLIDFYISNYDRLRLPEQDCITLVCWPYLRYLSLVYVVCNNYYEKSEENLMLYPKCKEFALEDKKQSKAKFFEILSSPVQIHYVGAFKPWNSFNISKSDRWFYYLRQSGCFLYYIMNIPLYIKNRMKRYSLRRFINKHLK